MVNRILQMFLLHLNNGVIYILHDSMKKVPGNKFFNVLIAKIHHLTDFLEVGVSHYRLVN